jgi:hypothetical protein
VNQFQINTAITSALDNLFTLGEQIHVHWYNELFTVNGEPIQENWTEDNLNLMEKDVENLAK